MKVTRSYVERAWNHIGASYVDGGSIIFQGNTMRGGGDGVFVSDVARAPVLIADNNFENQPWPIYLAQGLYANMWVPVAPATFIVRNNTINVIDNGNAITFVDNTGYLGENQVPRMNIFIENNKFELEGGMTWGIGGFGAHNARILNKQFRGLGDSAIVNGLATYYGDFDSASWLIKGNDVSALQLPPENTMAKIVLGELSHDCLAIVSSTDDVLDLGTNNIVRGGGLLRSGKFSALRKLQQMERMPRH
jgi:hypothetical protein